MHLTFYQKVRLFFGDFGFWFGLPFVLIGVYVLTQADWLALRFYKFPVSHISGQVISIRPTNTSINDDVVQDIAYRYRVGQLSRIGHSFSTDSAMRPGASVVVEYVVSQPAYARIKGTSNTVLPLGLAALFIGTFAGMGSWFVFKNIRRTQKLAAIIQDAVAAEATCHQLREKEDTEHKMYEAHYHYYFNGHTYNHISDTTKTIKCGVKEPIIFQWAKPTNAVLQASLPAFIRKELRPLKA